MFRHDKKNTPAPEVKSDELTPASSVKTETPVTPAAPVTLSEIKVLMEKNLKWSQILYEQNRKINRQIFWYNLSGWLKTLIILVPLVLAIIYVPPFFRGIINKYGSFLGIDTTQTQSIPNQELDQILNSLNLNSSQTEQVKTILGK